MTTCHWLNSILVPPTCSKPPWRFSKEDPAPIATSFHFYQLWSKLHTDLIKLVSASPCLKGTSSEQGVISFSTWIKIDNFCNTCLLKRHLVSITGSCWQSIVHWYWRTIHNPVDILQLHRQILLKRYEKIKNQKCITYMCIYIHTYTQILC